MLQYFQRIISPSVTECQKEYCLPPCWSSCLVLTGEMNKGMHTRVNRGIGAGEVVTNFSLIWTMTVAKISTTDYEMLPFANQGCMHALHSPSSYTEHLYYNFELSLKLRALGWYVSLNWNSCDNFGQWSGNKSKIKTGMLNWVDCWPEQGKFSQCTRVRSCGISYQSIRRKVKEICKLACKWVQA